MGGSHIPDEEETAPVNGADSLLSALEHNGVTTCFANPGTSEMHFVAALDGATRIRGVLGLFEGAVTGAADGYARMADEPAATLLHLGPGLANGLSNLHNARRAHSPVVNVIGDHASYHRALDAPLTSDVEGTARPFSHWVRTSSGERALSADVADAVTVARRGEIASLILPADAAWNELPDPGTPPTALPAPLPQVDALAAEAAARRLHEAGPRGAILLGGRTPRAEALEAAARIAAATGAEVLTDTFAPRVSRGAGRHAARKVPYAVGPAQELFARFDTLVLVGARPPVAFFAYPTKRSRLTQPDTRLLELCGETTRADLPLQAVWEALPESARTAAEAPAATRLSLPEMPSGSITPEKLGAFLGRAIPENAVVADESITTGWAFDAATRGARPHEWFNPTGGSIGWALPVATGAALACPERKVIALESDGSGMYMPQTLWTQAREGVDVVSLVFANRRYQILRNEMANVGVEDVGERAGQLLDLDRPVVDWVSVSRGFGVPAWRAETMEELSAAFDRALAAEGPALIEVVL
ncbi:acetolactate synthase large subunit [Brevibacterium album]|uniref:acetolactate synthase large subunit n=1 Tax=Brevibacterium album TaxID=417948 RepID=UPI001FE03356|nr:acetolactate synthase large subunit [Brevibacterium album]